MFPITSETRDTGKSLTGRSWRGHVIGLKRRADIRDTRLHDQEEEEEDVGANIVHEAADRGCKFPVKIPTNSPASAVEEEVEGNEGQTGNSPEKLDNFSRAAVVSPHFESLNPLLE
jgi:hypothetical protein